MDENDLQTIADITKSELRGVTMKIKDVTDYIYDEETGETYKVFKTPSGKPIGKIIRTIPVENPITGACVNWYTVDLDNGIGEFTISEKDEITDERLKVIAEYKRYCIQQELNTISSQKDRLDNRLSDIDKLLKELITE